MKLKVPFAKRGCDECGEVQASITLCAFMYLHHAFDIGTAGDGDIGIPIVDEVAGTFRVLMLT